MSQSTQPAGLPRVRYASAAGRGLIAATVLGSGVAFLDESVVNVALPAIGRDLGGGFDVLQWVLGGYRLTLSALLMFGGALGDHYGRRRIYLIGLVIFCMASLGCGLAPTAQVLIIARILQGVGGALLVPGSLAMIDATFHPDDRGRAIGTWAGLTGAASAIGPFVGGWLVDAGSWRLVFLINLPIAAAAVIMTLHSVPESRDLSATGRPDVAGAITITAGLSGILIALIQGPAHGWTLVPIACGVVGVAALATFVGIERRHPSPMLPLTLFRSIQFTGANLTTLAVYGALGAVFFLLSVQLQLSMGYSAVEAGLSTLPSVVIMMLLSGRVGSLAQRSGPRLPMTVGPIITAIGVALLTMAVPGHSYLTGVFPGVVVFGLGMAVTVAPLTGAVLAVDEKHVGAASGTNNAISRLASMLAVAVVPAVSGLEMTGGPLGSGFVTAMIICAALCGFGGLTAALTIRSGIRFRPHTPPSVSQACQAPYTRDEAGR
ncbi:MFS transporter [Microlunatus sp. Gsoil 973]|uniref:MFS transporter n=1 Tax=Microlunatus sp. Gsoil 973 TaxID=2672569 RepID=UPI0012B4E7B8|nr:MFS transporter [Microlunatus sp. Gsoil 973]QGN33217.1 MFS transporter [Microlunatus sp. Gsoil 973]